MNPSKKRWIWLLLPLFTLILLSGILLASESQSPPIAQTDPTPEVEEDPTSEPEADPTSEPEVEPTPEAETDEQLEETSIISSTEPSQIDFAMYFQSQPQDADECYMTVVEGELVFDQRVSNPAMSCPDAFSWKLFLDALEDEFWLNWAADQFTWPEEPYPICEPDAEDRSACCTPGSLDNPGYDDPENPGVNCPYFPGAHNAGGSDPLILESNLPMIAQDSHFASKFPQDPGDTGRVIRQEMAELVFRNEAFFNYVFENNIYHTDGLAEVFANGQASLTENAPYQQQNAAGDLVRIDFPIEAIMVKTNWLHEDRAAELGITNDSEHPYITMDIESFVTDNNGTIFEPGLHYLVAFHISSKDVPGWVWTTFEHVNNPGRCDITGCNDSFGYFSHDEVSENEYRNFTAPHTKSDDLTIPSTIFDPGLTYDSGEITPELAAIFEDLEIGSTEQVSGTLPSPTDSAWQSYRLKGSQTAFSDNTGRDIIVGNSVTEAGFLSTSSCMTCHARAAVDDEGGPALGVFISELAEDGYADGSVGLPDPNWFYSSSSSPSLEALQTDFVWGILFANPLADGAEE